MRELITVVAEGQAVFPMKVPRPRGLAKILDPEAASGPTRYDHQYPFGLELHDFDPPDTDLRPGRYRPSAIDRLLATHEEEADTLVLDPVPPLCSPDEWFDALMLPTDSRQRRNPRFLRVLQEYSHPSKYTSEQKAQMLHGLRYGMACDPERAGFKDGVVPYHVPGFDPDDPYPGWQPPVEKGKKTQQRGS